MKRAVLAILFFCFLVSMSESQLWKMRRYEIVGGLGTSMFFGDIGGYSKTENILGLRDLSIRQTRYDMNFSFRYRITREINARFSLTQAVFHATDSRGSNENRGFDAYISVIEPALIGEYYFMKNTSENSYLFAKGKGGFIGGIMGSLDVYAFTGIGGLSYKIKANDKLIARQTADNLVPGSFTGIVPVGLGSSLTFSPYLNFGIEFGGRYTFTDFLDGFHPIQQSSSNDVYYFFNLTVTYKLKTTSNGFPSFR